MPWYQCFVLEGGQAITRLQGHPKIDPWSCGWHMSECAGLMSTKSRSFTHVVGILLLLQSVENICINVQDNMEPAAGLQMKVCTPGPSLREVGNSAHFEG